MTISRNVFWWVLLALIAGVVALVWADRRKVEARAQAMQTQGAEGGAAGSGNAVDIAAMDCPTPYSNQAHPTYPLQGGVAAGVGAFKLANGTAKPLASFAVEGRVLGRRNYDSDKESRYSPTDIALGWSRMRDPAVLARLNITQSSRWYHYNWSGDAPLPMREIVESSANMHMIPANARIADALADVEKGDIVRLDGFLVSVSNGEGWAWNSSMTRSDSGDGACEVVYVCQVRIANAR